METLYIYADFDFLKSPELIGSLHYDRVRGRETYSFEYDKNWLLSHKSIVLSADLQNFSGLQYAEENIFGCFADALPDRWGRTLIKRRELIEAQEENRPVKNLSHYDFLVGIDDFSRMGGLRFCEKQGGEFINSSTKFQIPPITSLRELLHAADEIEKSENLSQLPDKKWIAQLIKPGTSLGGARPKACVIDEKGNLTVAKFPSRNDDYDVGLWEHFCCLLAKNAGINVAETRIIDTGQKYHTLLSRRFDRDVNGRRIHFASSLTMLGFQDGDGSRTGKGYLDIVDFILQNGGNVTSDLEQLFARVAFNICVGNCDDHFRNHGFLLTKNGWQLSPAYDLNPSLSYDHAIMITDNTNHSDLQMLYNNCESYMLEPPKAKEIIQRVCDAVSDWQRLAVKLQIAKAEMEMFRKRFEEGCNIKYGL